MLARFAATALAALSAACNEAPLPPSSNAALDPLVERDLLASEQDWPYQVALIADWKPPERPQPLRSGTRAVLIRVEEGGLARLDFGRHGIERVPLASTDLLLRANRIRSGDLLKEFPNFTQAIGQRLLDSGSEELTAYPGAAARPPSAYLCVFADPEAPVLAEIAAALAPLRSREGLETILFPQGRHPDLRVRERLRELGWTVPFVYAHLAEPYTRTLIDADTPLPSLLLQSAEGRLRLLRSGIGGDLPALASEVERLLAAVDSAEAP